MPIRNLLRHLGAKQKKRLAQLHIQTMELTVKAKNQDPSTINVDRFQSKPESILNKSSSKAEDGEGLVPQIIDRTVVQLRISGGPKFTIPVTSINTWKKLQAILLVVGERCPPNIRDYLGSDESNILIEDSIILPEFWEYSFVAHCVQNPQGFTINVELNMPQPEETYKDFTESLREPGRTSTDLPRTKKSQPMPKTRSLPDIHMHRIELNKTSEKLEPAKKKVQPKISSQIPMVNEPRPPMTPLGSTPFRALTRAETGSESMVSAGVASKRHLVTGASSSRLIPPTTDHARRGIRSLTSGG
ncbi:hypothetical protein EDC01DRAFT_515726 [Geopyxis carbonaria]|nr:hypothetical protein EDC01DRAFT_515726 [Geopyxis carbonaria]